MAAVGRGTEGRGGADGARAHRGLDAATVGVAGRAPGRSPGGAGAHSDAVGTGSALSGGRCHLAGRSGAPAETGESVVIERAIVQTVASGRDTGDIRQY